MLAGVVEAADLPVGATDDQQGDPEVAEREVVTGVRDVLDPTGDDPRVGPQVGLLQVPELLARVASRRDVVEGRESLGRGRALELVAHVRLDPLDQFGVHHPVTTFVVVAPAGEFANIASESKPMRPSGSMRITTRPGLSRWAANAACADSLPGRTLAASTG